MKGIIYRAYDCNGKSYIGQTCKSLDERIKAHWKRRNDKQFFHTVLLEKGLEAFNWEILEDDVPEDELNNAERYWINVFNSFNDGYNRTRGGGTSILTRQLPEDVLVKIKINCKNRSVNSGWKLSDETKQKMSAAKRMMSDETKQKMSVAKKDKHRININGKSTWVA